MRSALKYTSFVIALLMMLGACTGLPSATVPAATQGLATTGPALTEAPGSTDAAPVAQASAIADATVTNASGAPASAASPVPPPTESSPATPEAAAIVAAAPTEPPEPTLPPAPTQVAAIVACTPGALTPEQTEGPYYKANPPQSSDLLQPGIGGTKLTLTGYVLDAECKPIPGARVDFWQADSEGQYDNQGYTLRGYQVTDAQGRYDVETVVPGLYPGRTRHIHVKVTPPGGPTLTTQLYFPNEAANASDNIFSPDLIMKLEKTDTGDTGSFNFVVSTK